MIRNTIQRVWLWAEQHQWAVAAKVSFRLLIWNNRKPILISRKDIESLRAQAKNSRENRLQEIGKLHTQAPGADRKNMVSIGIFACNRFDLLKRTCDSFAEYLAQYGHDFEHEVMLFHDGENQEIHEWAQNNPLFDKIFFNSENHGLSKNINRFWFEESKGKYILNIEDDWACEFKNNFVRCAVGVLEADQDVGCVRMGRRRPDDYRAWNEAFKIAGRIISEITLSTPAGLMYHIIRPGYDNSCTLYRFSSLALTGRLRNDAEHLRSQEGEYMRQYDRLWVAARGNRFEDSPFLHIGEGNSVPTWKG
jgi:hypothetical protein